MGAFTVTNLTSGDLSLNSPNPAKVAANAIKIAKGGSVSVDELPYRLLKAKAAGQVSITPTTLSTNSQYSAQAVALVDGTTGSTYSGQLNKIYNVTTYAISQQNDSVLAQNILAVGTDVANLYSLVKGLYKKVYGEAMPSF